MMRHFIVWGKSEQRAAGGRVSHRAGSSAAGGRAGSADGWAAGGGVGDVLRCAELRF